VLGAERRLRRRADFERLLRQGLRRTVAGYTFYLGHRDTGAPRLGILVTRRHAAGAAERNRIKRCIREAFRLEQEALGPLDVLVRPPYDMRPSGRTLARLRTLFSKLTT
jgi:ribonuclease P protein component